jgi:tetratricopeptide (TPR) repeat protein
MGLFERLFGGGSPDAKARKAEEKARREAEEQAERRAKGDQLLQIALGTQANARSYDARSKAAISLVISSLYDHGIKAWESIARDFPNEAPSALQQVGACHHLKKDYRAALEAYARAIKAGYDPDLIADSIESATKGLDHAS